MRKNISTNTPSEKRVGYSRAVIVDNRIYFSGTTSRNQQGKTVGTTTYRQAVYCFEKIKRVLEKQGFSPKDVVAITAYLVDMKYIGAFDKAFIKHFHEVKPCCTLIGIKELVSPDLLIEIECIAEKS